jgi:hypothetical protein
MTVPDASLVIAGGLLFGAVVCWISVWAQPADERWTSTARSYLPALADWTVAAIVVHALTLIAAGNAEFTAWAVAAIVAGVALLLRRPPETQPRAVDEPPPSEQAPAPPGPLAPADPGPLTPSAPAAPRRSLWADPGRGGRGASPLP